MIQTDSHISARDIDTRLRAMWNTLRHRHRAGVIMGGIGLFLSVWFLVIMLEWAFWMPPVLKSILMLVTIGSGLWYSLWLYFRHKPADFERTMVTFTDQFGQQEVRYVIDLYESGNRESIGLYEAALIQNLERINLNELGRSQDDFLRRHPVSDVFRTSLLIHTFGLVMVIIMVGFQQPAVYRTMAMLASFERDNPYSYVVTPGNQTIEQGTSVEIRVSYSESIPDQSVLAFKTPGETDYRLIRMEPSNSNGEFLASIPAIFDDFSYQIRMDGYRSDQFEIKVQLLPRFSTLNVTVIPPSYTGQEGISYEYPFRRVEALPGSEIVVNTVASQPLEYVLLNRISVPDENASMQKGANNREFHYEFTVAGPDSVWFTMSDLNGLINRNSFSFSVEPIIDEFPEVRLITPRQDISIMEPEAIDIVYQLADDFGFYSVELAYEITRSFGVNRTQPGRIRLRVPNERTALDEYRWDISQFGLLPMDQIKFWIVARDNDVVSGYKSSQSGVVTINVSSLTDHLLAQEQDEQDLMDRMSEFREAYEQNQKDLQELRERIMDQTSDQWEQARETEAIREQREELSKQLDDIQQKFEELTGDMQSERSLSDETKAMYEELQQLMKEIDDPDILAALQKLQQGLESLDQNMVRDALQQLDFDEERFRERLNRTAELFKSLQMNAELDRMSSILEDLAQREDALIGDNLPQSDEQIQRQEQIRSEMDALKDRMDRLGEKSPQRAQQQIQELNDQVQSEIDQTDTQLQQDIDEMRESGGDSSPQQQQRREEIRDRMQQMQQQMQQSRAMMNQQQIQVNRQALVGLMQNLLLLSEDQEQVVNRVSESVQGSSAFIELARRQRNITSSFSLLTDSLYKVSAQIPSFPNRVNTRKAEVLKNLENSIELMAERDRNRSVAESRVAMGGINEIGSLLADLLEQLDNSQGDGSGSGGMSPEQMLEQLQQMSESQQQLNQQLQDMINDLQGERLMQDQMDRLDQMARQQNDIRRQFREIQRGGALRPGDELMSELQRLSDQMEDAINDLRGGAVDRVMIDRQQNILSRMLQAERAVNERERDEEREGRQPEDINRISPAAITLESLREQIRRALRDGSETRFSDEYQQLIQRYFELLEELERRQPTQR